MDKCKDWTIQNMTANSPNLRELKNTFLLKNTFPWQFVSANDKWTTLGSNLRSNNMRYGTATWLIDWLFVAVMNPDALIYTFTIYFVLQ